MINNTTVPLWNQELPRLVDGGEEVAPQAPVEEEFDLSDILAEEVSAAPGSKEELLRRADLELQVRPRRPQASVVAACQGLGIAGTVQALGYQQILGAPAIDSQPCTPLESKALKEYP